MVVGAVVVETLVAGVVVDELVVLSLLPLPPLSPAITITAIRSPTTTATSPAIR